MIEFGVNEARLHFSQLLARVEAGERVGITRYGKSVAQLVPCEAIVWDEDDIRTAIDEFDALRARNRLHGLSIRALIEEGRRH